MSKKRKSPDTETKVDEQVFKRIKSGTDGVYIKVYTDGSCDLTYRVCGSGVYFPSDVKRNISTSDIPGNQTNQRAELFAIYKALVETRNDTHVKIYTDSMYSINCIKKVYNVNANLDILDMIENELNLASEKQYQRRLKYVKGHSGNEGNNEADKLAKQAMREKRVAIIQEQESDSSEDES